MRWAGLFADLEAQLEASAAAELAAEVDDRTRAELTRIALAHRLRAAVGTELTLRVRGVVQPLRGELAAVGPDWLLLSSNGADQLVPLAASTSVSGLPAYAAEPETVGIVESRLSLGHALRGLARDRATVVLALVDGTQIGGTIDRVGADFLDLAEHALDEPRRAGSVRGFHAVGFAALAVVRAG